MQLYTAHLLMYWHSGLHHRKQIGCCCASIADCVSALVGVEEQEEVGNCRRACHSFILSGFVLNKQSYWDSRCDLDEDVLKSNENRNAEVRHLIQLVYPTSVTGSSNEYDCISSYMSYEGLEKD